ARRQPATLRPPGARGPLPLDALPSRCHGRVLRLGLRSAAPAGRVTRVRFTIFCHSLVSDWNHGNAHFLRGVTAELIDRGHDVRVFDPASNWCRETRVHDYSAS